MTLIEVLNSKKVFRRKAHAKKYKKQYNLDVWFKYIIKQTDGLCLADYKRRDYAQLTLADIKALDWEIKK